jgi:hypothetical protein
LIERELSKSEDLRLAATVVDDKSQLKPCKNKRLQAIYKTEIPAISGQPTGITAISCPAC